jgi:hypothetical protein
MKRTLILSILWILLPLIAHTQKLSKDSSNWSKLDSLRTERRLVVLGVRSLDYYIVVNSNLSLEIQSLTKINAVNESYIEQLEGLNEGLSEELNEGLRSKKKWRNATLLISGANVIFLTSIFLSR